MTHIRTRLAGAVLPVVAAALIVHPASAQEAAPPPQTVPVPVVAIPPAVVPTIPPDDRVTSPSRPGIGDPQSSTPIDPAAAAQVEAEEAAHHAAAPRKSPARVPAAHVNAPPPAVRAVAPSPAPSPLPPTSSAASSAPAAPATPIPPTAAPTASPTTAGQSSADHATTTETVTRPSRAIWPWLLAGLAAIAVLAGLLLLRRRRSVEDEWVEPAVPERMPVAAPVAEPVAMPIAVAASPVPAPIEPAAVVDEAPIPMSPDDATLSDADEDDVAALTNATPVDDRPWLEFALRPLRAGISADEAQVEIELTIANAGTEAAEEVHIATYLLERDSDGALAALLADPPSDADVQPVTIAAGEGLRLDATLAMPRASLTGPFQPLVIVDAHYRLGGRQSRTSATFEVGRAGEQDRLEPVTVDQAGMRDDVEARLYREPQRT